MSSLKQKSVIGVTWSLTERFGIYLIKFVIGVILARLLTPDAFGLIGMIYVFFAVADVFVNSGLGMAYVQKKEITDADANTIFYTNLFISIVLYGALFFGAPGIAKFYDQPPLIDLTRVMGFVVILNAFNIIQQAQIARAVDFKKRAKITIIATFISGSTGVVSAYMGLGVWALVIQSMANRTLIAIGFWISSEWNPKWQFSVKSFRELFAFGFWMLLTNVIRRIFDNIYVLAIGKFFLAAQVGYYTKAKQFQRMASENLTGAIGSVSFPVYTKIQDDKAKLQKGMRKFLQHSLIFIVPLVVGLIVVAKPFVIILIKEKWAPMIPYLQLLCVAGVFYPIHLVNIQALVAQGRSRLSFKLDLVKNGLRLINIAVMSNFGIIYIILGEVMISVIALALNTWMSQRLVNYGFWKQMRDLWQILAGGVFAGLLGMTPTLFSSNLWVLLIFGIILTMFGFLGFQYVTNRKLLIETIELKQNFRKS